MRTMAMRFAFLLALCGSACGGDDGTLGTGTLRVIASGGVEAREGMISASAFVDGYAARIDAAVLAIDGLEVRTETGEDAAVDVAPVLVDLVPSPVRAFELQEIPARRWDRFGWRHAPPPADVTLANAVDPRIRDLMVANGYSFYMEGVLIPPPGTVDAEGTPLGEVPYALGFPVVVTYRRCISGIDGTFGAVVPNRGVAEVEISWHLTHAFFDSFAEESALRGAAIAAAWTGEGPVTISDLERQDLAALRDVDGSPLVDADGYPVLYVPGGEGAETLRDFVLAARFGHFNGLEGFCTTELMPTSANP